jgi:hypothetical protein
LIGYTSSRDCEFLETRKDWSDFSAKPVGEVALEIEKIGAHAEIIQGNSLLVSRKMLVSVRVARWTPRKKENHAQYWSFARIPSAIGWISGAIAE